MTKNEERERLIREVRAAYQKGLKGAYGVDRGLLQIKDHESREKFVEILNDFGLTEIEGEAICKNMRLLEEPEAAIHISEILLKAAIRQMEGADG
ncbi:MAG: hypothetical protein D4R73_02740 [Deltaproteobacteria bacterium]|nr:MAG: hypothetical protein D4R73_02740 [Deltaproteobacteria bacterium]